jgi:hypothetical protein
MNSESANNRSMERDQARREAEEWLKAHNYKQWPDGMWHDSAFRSDHGYEVDVLDVLTEYIASTVLA